MEKRENATAASQEAAERYDRAMRAHTNATREGDKIFEGEPQVKPPVSVAISDEGPAAIGPVRRIYFCASL